LHEAVGELLGEMLTQNQASTEDVAALVFTLQDDLVGANPAAIAREHGFSQVPLLMVREHGGDTRVAGCVRALMLINTGLPQGRIRHAYLRGARQLRPDLVTVQGDLA
jgi:chorismate mutase